MRLEVLDVNEKEQDYYLTGELSKKEIEMLDKILRASKKSLRRYNKRIVESAKLSKRKCMDITLRDEQVRPVLMSLVTKRFFIGDKPGLGKTVMSCGAYVNYRYHMLKRGKKPKKVLVVTMNTHVLGFQREWKSMGVNLLVTSGGSSKVERTIRRANLDDFDGLIMNWDTLKTNGFLDYYLRNADDYGFIVLDETSYLAKDKSDIYKVTDNIVNKYAGGIERVLMLNGTSFSKSIFDYFNQFKILQPKLIPSKKFLEDRYVVRGGKEQMVQYIQEGNYQERYMMARHLGEIIDYKNQEELRERLKYYYIARDKKDFAGDIPKHNHKLHLVEMTKKQAAIVQEKKMMSLINSPETSDSSMKMTLKNSPKYDYLVEYAEMVKEDRPILYVYNRKAQKTVQKELKKRGYKVEVLNGGVSKQEKDEIIESFDKGKLDMLVFNIEKAINIPSSNRIIFYDIPTMPGITTQVKGRIDRDNYDTPKYYDFLCYLDSPEMVNIVRLAYFREKHGNKFTGQEDFTYQELIQQLTTYYDDYVMAELEKYTTEEDFFDEEDWEDIIEEIILGR